MADETNPKVKKIHNMNPKSLANLVKVQKGEVKNPAGRRGKDGHQGFSLKGALKRYLNELSDTEKENFFSGLYQKVRGGDVPAIKLMAELNDEMIPQIEMSNNLGCVIIPSKAPKIPEE